MRKAVVLLNMGGARNKDELKEFLFNMFFDKRIINSPIRYFLAPLMRLIRTNKAWENYEKIGGSKIYTHTESLTKKIQALIGDEVDIYYAMRYTKPRVSQVLQNKNYQEIMFIALYPHHSITTTLSSYDDVDNFAKNSKAKIIKIDHFFEDEEFNQTIINSIKNHYKPNSHLIFSAHGLPLSIAKKDLYEGHIHLHVKLLKEMLKKENLEFVDIHIAYQSKIGPVKWLTPAIDETIRSLPKNSSILVYPVSFVIDNSETDFELALEYKHVASKLGFSYDVCKAQNDSDEFAKYLSNKIKNSWS
ncbi:MAG: ferrochelatase [Campylobacteraceae bacterium]